MYEERDRLRTSLLSSVTVLQIQHALGIYSNWLQARALRSDEAHVKHCMSSFIHDVYKTHMAQSSHPAHISPQTCCRCQTCGSCTQCTSSVASSDGL